MKEFKVISLILCCFLVFSYKSIAKTTAYKDSTHGFSLKIPAGWQQKKDSLRSHYVTFYRPEDKTGHIPTFVVTIVDKQDDFIAFVDAVIKEEEAKTKDYVVINKTCTQKNRCEVLTTYSFDPKSIMVDTKKQKNVIGVDSLKTRQIFIKGENKFYVLSAGSFNILFNHY